MMHGQPNINKIQGWSS